jgi:Ca2+:H+ antiporter
MSFFCGGIVGQKKKIRQTLSALNSSDDYRQTEETEFVNEKVQTFSAMSALVNTSMLLLSCLSFSLVTVFSSEGLAGLDETTSVLLPVSRTCSIIIMLAYVAYIFFQLVTHREAMAEEEGPGNDEEPTLSIPTAITVMLCTTFIVAFSSELLVASLEGVVEKARISQHFIGIILLPIVGNACEHASAIRFAIMDKPGLSIGIAVGSSTQMSLFVVPFSVIVGWIIDKPMDLNFGSLNTTVMSISVIVVLSVVVDGTANWLQGYLLVSGYLIIAVLYWHLPNQVPEEI